MNDAVDNLPEFRVMELSRKVQRAMEGAFDRVRVRGEIGRVNAPSSGHLYFAMKEERAVLECVAFRQTNLRLAHRPEQGLEMVATGRLTTYYQGRSRYQLVVKSMAPAGIGALMALLEKRRQALAAEGLFDEAGKRPLPYLPSTVGVVASPSGAAIRDIMHRLRDRFPCHVLWWETPVQGKGAAEGLAAAIRGFNLLDGGGGVPRPDVLIVARGGGSAEDLWAFNEEVVVRAAAASAIPVISAIGHESDTTLLDHAAARRAPTPTAAAEMAVPVKAELEARLLESDARLVGAASRLLERSRSVLASLARGLAHPARLVERKSQDLDNVAGSLRRVMALGLAQRRQRLAARAQRLVHARPAIALKRAALSRASAGLSLTALAARLHRADERLQRGGGALEAAIRRRLDDRRRELARVVAGLNLASRPAHLVKRKSRDLDNVTGNLRRVMALELAKQRQRLAACAQRLVHPRAAIALKRAAPAHPDAGRAGSSDNGRRVPGGPPRPAWPLGLAAAAAVLLADQVSKVLLVGLLQENGFQPLEITSFFRLVMVRNTGIGFGLLAGGHELMRWLLVAFAGVAALALTLWMMRPGTGRLQGAALGLVVGGALGNATDRVLHGAVADFFEFHIAGWSWPAFNLADSAIVVGVAMLLVDALLAGGGGRKLGP